MPDIQLLDKHTIDQIAAGEVVERPASVVKELVENAIDAGCQAVTVEIRQGGISFIRITDNGCGIAKDQVQRAFLRHATSKLRSVEELSAIVSLGFRGEALSSIAAVAQVELITKEKDALTGCRYCIEGGQEMAFEEVGAPDGTTILVRNLFYNVPARAKFLKTAQTEGNYITDYMQQLALSHPDVSFKYMLNGQVKFQTSGNGKVEEIIYQIFGRDITRELIPVAFDGEEVCITGFTGKPVISRGNRSLENYYVNGRYVKNRIVEKAIEEAYQGYLMKHQYPFTCLFLELCGSHVDINVHPAKLEVRFSEQERVYMETKQALLDCLRESTLIPHMTLEEKVKKPARNPEPVKAGETKATETLPKPQKPVLPEPFEKQRRKELLPRLETPAPAQTLIRSVQEEPGIFQKQPAASPAPAAVIKPLEEGPVGSQMELFSGETAPLRQENIKQRFRIIGQLFDTYWLFEMEEELFILDQHAAHEKLLYEQLMRDFKEKTITSQLVSPPAILHLTMKEHELISRYLEVFAAFGFDLEDFGQGAYAVVSVPYNLYGIAPELLFKELLSDLQDNPSKDTTFASVSHKLAVMACKAAVKGNQALQSMEISHLMEQLLSCENPYQCPHGRPTVIRIHKTELEKRFRRIL